MGFCHSNCIAQGSTDNYHSKDLDSGVSGQLECYKLFLSVMVPIWKIFSLLERIQFHTQDTTCNGCVLLLPGILQLH